MFPGFNFSKEGVTRTGGVVHHLSVALDGEVSRQCPSINSALRKSIPQQARGVAGRQRGRVVPDDRHTIADAVVSSGVGAAVGPTPPFINISIRTHHEAGGGGRDRTALVIYPLIKPSGRNKNNLTKAVNSNT